MMIRWVLVDFLFLFVIDPVFSFPPPPSPHILLSHQGCPLYEYIVAVSNLTVFSPAVVDSVIALCIEQCLSEKWHVRPLFPAQFAPFICLMALSPSQIRHAVSPVLEVLCFRHSMCILASRRLDVATSLSLLYALPSSTLSSIILAPDGKWQAAGPPR